jgi:hypothetical protein
LIQRAFLLSPGGLGAAVRTMNDANLGIMNALVIAGPISIPTIHA